MTSMGRKLMEFMASIEATDAKTITLKLVLESIGKPSSYVPMPPAAGGNTTRLADQGTDRIRSLQVRAGGIPAQREGSAREDQRLFAASTQSALSGLGPAQRDIG
jgi:hypothetical protein